MRVFITGATGFIGIPVARELIAGGHEVLGMARSEAGAQSLLAAGAEVHRGSLGDISPVERCRRLDAVIHLALLTTTQNSKRTARSTNVPFWHWGLCLPVLIAL